MKRLKNLFNSETPANIEEDNTTDAELSGVNGDQLKNLPEDFAVLELPEALNLVVMKLG